MGRWGLWGLGTVGATAGNRHGEADEMLFAVTEMLCGSGLLESLHDV